MTHRWLVLRFEAPLMAFGGVAIDHVGRTRDFPSASLLTGLIGNALGWCGTDRAEHQRLQDRLIFAARRDREGTSLSESQNVQLSKDESGWTTFGTPEGRRGSSYDNPHRRRRDYHADSALQVALSLDPAAERPSLEDVAGAVERPARPLFLGRKSCLPAVPMLGDDAFRWVDAPTAHAALCRMPGRCDSLRAQWPEGQGPETGPGVDRILEISDLRNWHTGLHGGSRRVVEGRIVPGG